MARKKINWSQAKADYVADQTLSLEQLAKNYGISYGHLRNVAMKEGWTKLKEEKQSNAEKKALEEVEGSLSDLIVRHVKVARYLQSAGIKYLKFILDEIEDLMTVGDEKGARKLIKSLIYNKIISPNVLMNMVSEGLKAERELYPKQMKVSGGVTLEGEGLSPELEEVIYEAFKQKLIDRSRKDSQKTDTVRKATAKK